MSWEKQSSRARARIRDNIQEKERKEWQSECKDAEYTEYIEVARIERK